MTSTPRLIELAAIIQRHVSVISRAGPGSTETTFFAQDLDRSSSIEGIREAKDAVLGAATELQMLLQEPVDYLMNMVINQQSALSSLHAICRFDIASSIPVDQEVSCPTVAQRCGISESDTARLLRHAMTYYIFREPAKGIFAHTAVSRVLAEDPLLVQWVDHACEDIWPAATRIVEAMTKWPSSQEPNQAGFNVANDTTDAVFAGFSKHMERARRFSLAMSYFQSRAGLAVSNVIDGYDWNLLRQKGFETSTFVDIGGSHGMVSIEIARKYPFIRCIVQDQPEVLKHSDPIAFELQERVTFMEHDFFQEQPIKGAAAYFLRWILHDWSDNYATKILRALVPSLKPGSKIIVNELCMPALQSTSIYQERSMRSFDMAMKALQNGRERSADDWAQLFRNAHPKLRLESVHRPPQSDLSMIVAEWTIDTIDQ